MRLFRLFQRKKVFVDPRVQGAMLLRLVIYWVFGLLAIAQILLFWQIITSPPAPFLDQFRFDILWAKHGSVVIASLIMLPIFLVDTVVVTNRFAGPLYRLRASIRALTAGERVEPLKFRDRDFWREVADEFNLLAVHVEQLKRQVAMASTAPKPETKDRHELDPVAAH
ncbi:MAG: hypothetical protein HY288_17070 [Planctomycetia bacterium]|nr:hypothetical protein [Planctomycetia bacterium]